MSDILSSAHHRFCINEMSFATPSTNRNMITEQLEKFAELLEQIHEQEQSIARDDKIWETPVAQELTLIDILYSPIAHDIADDVTRQLLRAAINRTVDYTMEPTAFSDYEHLETEHGSGIARIVACHHLQNGVACLTLCPYPTSKIVFSDGELEIFFVCNEQETIAYYRHLFALERISETGFHDHAVLAFPELFILRTHTKFNRFQHRYEMVIEAVIKHLSAINDHFRRIHQGCDYDHNCVSEQIRAISNVDVTLESVQTRKNSWAMRKRDVEHNGKTYRCEWHSKLFPTIDRIHFCPEENKEIAGKILVGLFTDHLPM